MLVDDHAIVRKGIAMALNEAQDIDIAGEAEDGKMAVDMAGKILPDVVLMDISMPVMDGIEATRLIHQKHPDVRVIGLSMFEEGEQSAAIRKAGACAYLTKSGDFEALLATIRAWRPIIP
jgi:NarL family two-component system response regulator LiaR